VCFLWLIHNYLSFCCFIFSFCIENAPISLHEFVLGFHLVMSFCFLTLFWSLSYLVNMFFFDFVVCWTTKCRIWHVECLSSQPDWYDGELYNIALGYVSLAVNIIVLILLWCLNQVFVRVNGNKLVHAENLSVNHKNFCSW
jgi:hypothetical protein